jgi:hypothetical protein
MLKYNYPILAFFVAHWPALIFLPSVIGVMVVLALITRAWDKRDEAARLQQQQ